MGFQFPDAAMSGKPMKASYINDLRNRINIARGQVGQSPINWGPDLNSGDAIRASHFKDVRDAIRSLWLTKDIIEQPSEFPGFASGEPNNLTPLFASQTSDPRLWLNDAVNRPTVQGVSSLCHDPTSSASAVTTSWVQDIYNLESEAAKRVKAVRCIVKRQSMDAPTPSEIMKYVNDFNKYRAPGSGLPEYTVFAMMNLETFSNSKPINAPLTDSPVMGSNEYIDGFTSAGIYRDGFAQAMSKLMVELYSRAGVKNFILWNEPNTDEPDKHMDPQVFAALLRRTWILSNSTILGPLMAGSTPTVRLYWGGIFMGKSGDSPDPSHVQYIRNVYNSVRAQKEIAGEDYGRSWPWHGINIHPHGFLSDPYCKNLGNTLASIQGDDSYGDSSDILIGEWGIKLEGDESQNWQDSRWQDIKPTFDSLRSANFTYMFYFAHHLNRDANNDNWGLRRYYFPVGQYGPCPDIPDPASEYDQCRVPGDKHGVLLSGRLGPPNDDDPKTRTLYDALHEALNDQ